MLIPFKRSVSIFNYFDGKDRYLCWEFICCKAQYWCVVIKFDVFDVFAFPIDFPYFCIHKIRQMNMWDKILFFKSLSDYSFAQYADSVLHILCTGGNMSFSFQDVRYNVVPGDYVILTNPALASDFSESVDFDAVIMSLSEAFVTSMAIQSNYGIIGHMSLLQNPVMKLSPHDYRICLEDMWKLHERLNETQHLFREEMLGHLLLVHILDLYDIHAKSQAERNISERNGDLLRRFVELLYHKEYIQNRNLAHYASRLCITPHYLTEVCKKVSGKPATYWIDRLAERTPADGNRGADEFLLRILLQPVCAEANQLVAIGI